jgi:nucleotide-binding universal stress UspA family protein
MKLLRIKTVLAAIDGGERSPAMLQGARELATAAGATLHVVHVMTPADAGPHGTLAAERAADRMVAGILDRAGVPRRDTAVHLLGGDPAYVIRTLADQLRADVIVLGRHRDDSATGEPFGSTALKVVTNSWAPCLILEGTLRLPLERVLVPVDLSETSRGALALALSWASALRGAEHMGGTSTEAATILTALLVEKTSDGSAGRAASIDALEEALSPIRQEAGTWASVTIDRVVRQGGDVAAVIAGYAVEARADLVVLGTRGLGSGPTGRLGSTSLGVARRVQLPVLLVPPAVWHGYGAGR